MTSFSLLRVPYVAQKEILSKMTPLDLYFLSQSSKRAKRLVRHSPMKKLGIELKIIGKVKTGQITIKHSDIAYNIIVVSTESYADDGEFKIHERNGGYYYLIFSDDVPTQMNVLMNYFHEVFGMNLSAVDLSVLNKLTLESIIDMIISRQPEIQDLKLQDIEEPGLDVTELLEKVRTVNKLWINAKLKSGFGFIFENVPQEAAFCQADWFTCQNLLCSEWEKLFVTGAPLTNSDINHLVEKWMEGNLPKLKFVAVKSEMFHDETPVAGIFPPVSEDEDLPQNLKSIEAWNVLLDVNTGTTLTNANGVTAKLGFQSGNNSIFFLYVSD
ncbi:hypothetical protein CAEBREN_13931 [Caenorhabditis brenneri]|uniref:F-box domain-containing protein n=1 Tax=Caenorhabditis brenneri TaxID=135651 RepID=G0N7V2_CAEBE|nr:hypothetical protein CAEBREN_13931 [Caenorhabditis brenneri]